jgi:dTDP-4-amino-4,6-dideoxygalactose transaminase
MDPIVLAPPQDVVPFGRPFIIGKELHYISQAVLQGSLAGDHHFTKQCNAWLEQNLGTHKALLTHSCTAALEMAAILIDTQPGDEVIMPSYTFVSTANAFVLRGGTPVFVDVRRDTLNLDEKLLKAAITPRTRAIVPVHYAGVSCDMDAILAIAAEHGLAVIEDAAQAFGSTHGGKALGTLGALGCMSFHETKNVISGEGGALFVNDPALARRAEIIREKGTNRSEFFRGQVDKYTWVEMGSSFLPGELVAAFLAAQLENSEEVNANRRAIVARYEQLMTDLLATGRIEGPGVRLSEEANGHMYYFFADSLDDRSALLHELRSAGVGAVFHYVPLHSSPAGERYGRVGSSMAVTDSIADRLVRLPVFYGLSESDQERLVDVIYDFYSVRRDG